MQNPPDQHPLFRHLVLSRNKFDLKFIWIGLGILLVVMLFVAQEIAMILLLAVPVLYALLNSTINGLAWGMNVVNTIVLERTHGTYDVLCLIPDGALRVNWIIFTERLHYNDSLENSYSDMRVIVQVLAIAIGFLSIGVLADPQPEIATSMGAVIIIIICLMVGIFMDYVQTVVTCGLLTMLVSNTTRIANDARLWMLASFLLVQVSMYIFVIFAILLVSPIMGNLEFPGDFFIAAIIPTIILLLYIAIRETIIRVLWRHLTFSLNADQSLRALFMPTR